MPNFSIGAGLFQNLEARFAILDEIILFVAHSIEQVFEHFLHDRGSFIQFIESGFI
nr:hypothetical protein [Helicobacter pylori]